MSSSDNPSEKYSWSFFSLMSTNGSTATDLSVIATAAADCATFVTLRPKVYTQGNRYPNADDDRRPDDQLRPSPGSLQGFCRSHGICGYGLSQSLSHRLRQLG